MAGDGDGSAGTRDFTRCPTASTPTVEADLRHQIDRLKAAGITEAVAVDLTKPEFGIPVVRVVIPGLEGLDDSPDYLIGERGRRIIDLATEAAA
ncbi:YcaO-like family protein [Azospirillum thermophilum]|uniref:YcaO-like family protein n=1 Tax=Azospirillum thermophilum TaxID=2202148 RepID=UPI00248198FD|nr:YcaO-like family protein [Azospirillum thermophilum]